MPEGAGPAVRPQHRFLNDVIGVLIGHAAAAGQPVEAVVVSAEELLEGAAIAGRVGRQQIGIAAIVGT